MTDKEKAAMEEWAVTQEKADSEMYASKKHCSKCIDLGNCIESAIEDRCGSYQESYEDYLTGFTEGKPRWHDLRKDQNDWPKENSKYIVHIKVSEIRTITDTGF